MLEAQRKLLGTARTLVVKTERHPRSAVNGDSFSLFTRGGTWKNTGVACGSAVEELATGSRREGAVGPLGLHMGRRVNLRKSDFAQRTWLLSRIQPMLSFLMAAEKLTGKSFSRSSSHETHCGRTANDASFSCWHFERLDA